MTKLESFVTGRLESLPYKFGQCAAVPVGSSGLTFLPRSRTLRRLNLGQTMKRIIPALSFAILLGGLTAHAQSDMIIKQRAKGIRDANNAQQGVPPPAAAPAPAAPAAPTMPPPPSMSPEQKALLDKLEADLNAIKPGATNLADQQKELAHDFSTLVKGGIKPSPASLAKLAADLSTSLSGEDVSGRDLGQLAKAINVVITAGA